MSKKDQQLVAGIVILALITIIIIINLLLAWITFNRFLFWFDLIVIPLSLVILLISVIALFIVGEWDRDFWLIIAGVAFVIFILSLLTISGAYNQGYSDEAIKRKAELEKMLEDYTFILSIYTGEFQIKVQEMILEDVEKALCEAAPETPCEQVIDSYKSYQELVGYKETADKIVAIWK